MILTPEDAKLFFELAWKLQYYVNQQHSAYKSIKSRDEYARLPAEKKLETRDALWDHPELINAYVSKNPDALPPEQLEIIRRWKSSLRGTFYILRHLKKGSIFIGDGDQVYSVVGLQDELKDMLPPYGLPIMTKAILLPFKGQIIYDGLLESYNIHFGGGIRSRLNHTYTVAKEKERIITSLEPDLAAPKLLKPRNTALPQLKELSASMAKLKGDNTLQSAALKLANLSLGLAIADAEGTFTPEDARKTAKASSRLLNLLDLLEED
ncbi:MAG: hypothetical protein WA821_22330 [Anaerolineales bacterium]